MYYLTKEGDAKRFWVLAFRPLQDGEGTVIIGALTPDDVIFQITKADARDTGYKLRQEPPDAIEPELRARLQARARDLSEAWGGEGQCVA